MIDGNALKPRWLQKLSNFLFQIMSHDPHRRQSNYQHQQENNPNKTNFTTENMKILHLI